MPNQNCDRHQRREFLNRREAPALQVEVVDGSDKIELAGISLGWSRGSGILIYLYPNAGMKYATIKVEQDGTEQPATALDSKLEGEKKPKSESEERSQ